MRYIVGLTILIAMYFSYPIIGELSKDVDIENAKEIFTLIAFSPVMIFYLSWMLEDDKDKQTKK